MEVHQAGLSQATTSTWCLQGGKAIFRYFQHPVSNNFSIASSWTVYEWLYALHLNLEIAVGDFLTPFFLIKLWSCLHALSTMQGDFGPLINGLQAGQASHLFLFFLLFFYSLPLYLFPPLPPFAPVLYPGFVRTIAPVSILLMGSL